MARSPLSAGSGDQYPTAHCISPANTDPRTGDSRMTVPRAPTDRRQIQSGSTWTRIDGQSASLSRPTAQLPAVAPRGGQADRAVKTLVPPPAIRVTPNSSANRASSPGDRDRAVSTPSRNESSGSIAGGSTSSGGDQGRSAGFVNRAESVAPRGQLSRPQANFNRP